MVNKIYDTIKYFIKDFWKEILFIVAFYFIMTYPVDYYIFTSGGTTDLNKRFNITESYKQDGSYSLSYVNELEGTVLTYLLSFVIPSWERAEISDYQFDNNETIEELSLRGKLSLEKANQTAIRLAYTKAGKNFIIKAKNYYITYRVDYSDKDVDIKIGDKIIKVNGKTLDDMSVLSEEIESSNVSSYINLELERNGRPVNTKVKVKEDDGKKVIGLIITTIYDYHTEPSISFSFKSDESGGSAGLMLTLAIYDSLIEEDLTKGKKIVGTGTIYEDGSVGEIGGVRYKLMGAISDNADIFLVPFGDNYEECINLKNEKNLDINIIGIESFDDAVTKLADL